MKVHLLYLNYSFLHRYVYTVNRRYKSVLNQFKELVFVYFGQDISESADCQIALLVQLTARENEKLLQ